MRNPVLALLPVAIDVVVGASVFAFVPAAAEYEAVDEAGSTGSRRDESGVDSSRLLAAKALWIPSNLDRLVPTAGVDAVAVAVVAGFEMPNRSALSSRFSSSFFRSSLAASESSSFLVTVAYPFAAMKAPEGVVAERGSEDDTTDGDLERVPPLLSRFAAPVTLVDLAGTFVADDPLRSEPWGVDETRGECERCEAWWDGRGGWCRWAAGAVGGKTGSGRVESGEAAFGRDDTLSGGEYSAEAEDVAAGGSLCRKQAARSAA